MFKAVYWITLEVVCFVLTSLIALLFSSGWVVVFSFLSLIFRWSKWLLQPFLPGFWLWHVNIQNLTSTEGTASLSHISSPHFFIHCINKAKYSFSGVPVTFTIKPLYKSAGKGKYVFFSLHSVPWRSTLLFQAKISQINPESTHKSLPLLFAYKTEMKEVHNKLSVYSHRTFLCVCIMWVKNKYR